MRVLLKGKVWDKESIQRVIDANDQAVARALMIVYANQTDGERRSRQTIEDNGVGFTGCDAEVLTEVAEKWKQWGRWASPRQANFVRRKVRKYHKQILQHMLATNPAAVEIKGRMTPGIKAQIEAPADGDYTSRALV